MIYFEFVKGGETVSTGASNGSLRDFERYVMLIHDAIDRVYILTEDGFREIKAAEKGADKIPVQ